MRAAGYYWVMRGFHWTIGEYYDDTHNWLIIGYEEILNDGDFEQIGDFISADRATP